MIKLFWFKKTSKKPIDLSLKNQKIKCLPVNKETAFIFKKEEFKVTYYDEIEVKENTQYQEYNKFDIDRITDISLQQLNECIKKTKNDKKKCYGEVIVFFYQNKSLVDIQKHIFYIKGKRKSNHFWKFKNMGWYKDNRKYICKKLVWNQRLLWKYVMVLII